MIATPRSRQRALSAAHCLEKANWVKTCPSTSSASARRASESAPGSRPARSSGHSTQGPPPCRSFTARYRAKSSSQWASRARNSARASRSAGEARAAKRRAARRRRCSFQGMTAP